MKKRETLSEIKEQQSLEKLKEFIETDLGEHKKLQMTMAKHINICDELTKLVSGRRYLPPFPKDCGCCFPSHLFIF